MRRVGRRNIEHDVQRVEIGYFHERLIDVGRSADRGVHFRYDTRDRRAHDRKLRGSASVDRCRSRLSKSRRRLLRVLRGNDARVGKPARSLIRALRGKERRFRALSSRNEGRLLESHESLLPR